MSVRTDTVKCFLGKTEEKYSFKKKSSNQENPKPQEPTVNEVMESIIQNENYPASEESISTATDEDNLMKLFEWFSGLTLPMSD